MGWSMDWVHGPGPWDGPWTRSIGWSMDPGPCFVYVRHDGITAIHERKVPGEVYSPLIGSKTIGS